jgi:Ferric reductase like transmembrane component
MVGVLSYNSKALWYLTRGFGLVALILLTISVVLGITQAVRYARPGLPRFLVSGLHRNASLLAVVVLTVHVTTAVMDSYAPIRVVDVFIPFVSKYRPIWTGLGALALDLLVALAVTSLLRERLGYRAWRAVHWSAYACWPVAVVHGLGTGSDSRLGSVQVLYVVCAAAVVGALWWRLAQGFKPESATLRGVAVLASVALPAMVAMWAASGPLRPGWARRSGTPLALLGSSVPRSKSASSHAAGSSGRLVIPFRADFSGVQNAAQEGGGGLVSITIRGDFRGTQDGKLTVVLTGEPAGGGGVDLTGSEVYVGPASSPRMLQGSVTSLAGSSLSAELQDSGGRLYTASIRLNVSSVGNQVTGALAVSS